METDSRKRRALLLGFTMADHDFEDVSNRSPLLVAQTQAFGSHLQRSLQHAGLDVALISFAPVTNYPSFPQIVFRSKRFEYLGDPGIFLGFINILVLKHLTRWFSLRKRALTVHRQNPPEVVVVHGVHTPLLNYARLLKKLFGSQIVAVLTDPPAVTLESDGFATRLLRSVDGRRVKRILRDFDRVVALTNALAEDFAPGVPSLVFPGFAPDVVPSAATREPGSSTFTVAYAGGLSEEYGVGDLVRSFALIADPRFRLQIFGRGPLTDWVQAQTIADPRISLDYVDRTRVLELLQGAQVLVNPRRLNFQAIRHSSPSKLLEYMSLAVPTISTPLPSISSNLAAHLAMTSDDGEESIHAKIMELSRQSDRERRDFGDGARSYVLREYSTKGLGAKFRDFF